MPAKYSSLQYVKVLNDGVLGAFSKLKPSPTLDHLLRYLSTWSGSDKFLMGSAFAGMMRVVLEPNVASQIIQYTAKLVVPYLHLRSRLQNRAGLRKDTASPAAEGLAKLASMISDARTLFGLWGILPIIQFLISLERNPPPTRSLLTIERLQGFSMLAFYPLSHISYLVSNSVMSTTAPSLLSVFNHKSKGADVTINAGKLSLWSTRLWAAYIVLQFVHLSEDRKLLLQRHRALAKAKGKSVAREAEKAELAERWDVLWNAAAVNLAFFPQSIHWSLEKGLFANDIWVNAFGLIAAVASFRSGWKATALPAPAPASMAEVREPEKASEGGFMSWANKDEIGSLHAFEDALNMPSLVA